MTFFLLLLKGVITLIFNYNEAIKKYKNDYGIKKALKEKKIYKIIKGIYSDKQNIDLAVAYSLKYDNVIVTMNSAFYYYGFTDVIPTKTYLAVPYNTHIKKNENVVFCYMDEKNLNEGKTTLSVYDSKINIYNKERLLIELIRKKNQIPFDYYKEIITNYRKITNELDMRKLEHYLTLFKNESTIGDTLLREVF